MRPPSPMRNLSYFCSVAIWITLVSQTSSVALAAGQRETPIVRAVRRAKPAVVNLSSGKQVLHHSSWPGNVSPKRVNGMGSGVIVDERGFIITNAHVVDRVTTLMVRLEDGSSYNADPIGIDRTTDLALVKINAGRRLPTIPLGTSIDLMIGETVIAVGNAYGYENTVTRGVISATGRTVRLNDELTYRELIQTDASINPGNSGGALINIDGELIGVNVAIRAGAQGISFAIPVDNVRRVAAELMRTSSLSQVWHGVKYRESIDRSSRLGTVTVEQVEGPAKTGGIQPADQIIRVDDRKIVSGLDFERSLLDKEPGDQVTVVVRRKGKKRTLTFTAEQLPSLAKPSANRIWQRLGLRLAQIEPAQVQRYQPQLRGGMYVLEVRPRSPADAAGLSPGDVLLGMEKWETLSYDNVVFVLTQHNWNNYDPVRVHVLRGNQLFEFEMEPEGT